MIQYRDFVPRQTAALGFMSRAEYESVEAAAAAATQWISDTAVDLVTLETVVLPNIHHPKEEGSGDADLHSTGEYLTSWHQFVRVWYR